MRCCDETATQRRSRVDLEDVIAATFVRLDDLVLAWRQEGGRLRIRGPQPVLADSEVLTMEAVGEFFGFDHDAGLVAYFQAHHVALFPKIAQVHRTTFARQAANLWPVKQTLQQRALVDSVLMPVCRFAHAPRPARQAARLRRLWPRFQQPQHLLRAAAACAGLLPRRDRRREAGSGQSARRGADSGVDGWGRGRGARRPRVWDPHLREELAYSGVALRAPFRKRSSDPDPVGSRRLNDRRRIETTFSQLAERYHLKRVWARDRGT